MEICKRFNALGHRCALHGWGYDIDGVYHDASEAAEKLRKLEFLARKPTTRIERPRIMQTWSATTPKPKAAKFISDADIEFCKRIVGNDRIRAIALAIQFAKGKLKSVRKAYMEA